MNEWKGKEYIGEILAIGCGVIGTIGCFLTTFPLEYHPFLFWGVLFLAGGLFYYVYTKRMRRKEMLGIALGYGAFVLLGYPIWKKALPYAVTTILKIYESNSQYRFQKPAFTYFVGEMKTPLTWLLLVVTLPFLLLLIRSLRCKHSYFLAFFATVPFIGAILLFTLPLPTGYGTMWMLFQMFLYGMANARKHGSSKLQLKAGISLGLCTFLILGGLRLYQPQDSYMREERIDFLREEVLNGFSSSFQNHTDRNGQIDLSRQGDRYYSGSVDLQIEMDHPQSLYIHAYSAPLYENNSWTQMSNERYLNIMRQLQGVQFHPFSFANDSAKGILTDGDQAEVRVINRNADEVYLYTPYYVSDDLSSLPHVRDSYIDGSDMEMEYSYHIWKESALDQLEPNSLIEAYRFQVSSVYAGVSVFLRDELKRIEIPGLSTHNSKEEKIRAIQNYMRSFGTYTLHPGIMPQDQDFVLYFLNTSKRGYCVHYASAAVLLLRSYGIEARYASGYYVNASDFQNGVAMVKDSQAHAWVEILDPVKGWTVLEVTPSATADNTDSIHPTQPNQEAGVNQPQESQTTSSQTSQNQAPPRQDANEALSTPIDQAEAETAPQALWLLSLLMPLLLLLFLPLRRVFLCGRRNRRLHQSDHREAILACGEYLYQLGIRDEEMDQTVKECLQEAKFSKHALTQRQAAQVLTYCERCRKQMREQKTVYQRFMDRYIRCL